MFGKVILFLLVNFSGLALGSLFTSSGVSSDWYNSLDKAPWTPPGWMFGAAWTLIMVCFAFYMSYAWELVSNKKALVLLFLFQWVLNFLWNPIFFKYHHISLALIVIVLLTVLIGILCFGYMKTLGMRTAFILPYLLWLIIASSLNLYIVLNN